MCAIQYVLVLDWTGRRATKRVCYVRVCIILGDHERRQDLMVSKGCDRFSDTVVLVQSGESTFMLSTHVEQK